MLLCCRDYRNNSKYIEDFNELLNIVRHRYEQNIKLNLPFRFNNLGYRLYFLRLIDDRNKVYTIVQSVT